MPLALPWPYVGGLFDRPKDVNELADRSQQNFEALANQFPVGGSNTKQVPQARVYNNAALTIATATPTALTFNSERYDTGTSSEQHSTSSNTGRLTCRVDGLYDMGVVLNFDANTTGERLVAIWVDGSTTIAEDGKLAVTGGYGTAFAVGTQYRLTAGQYVEVVVTQTSGGNLSVLSEGSKSPEFFWHWVSP